MLTAWGVELLTSEIEVEVPFHDADPMGVTWHGNYFRYLETARSALLNEHRLQLPADDGVRLLVADRRRPRQIREDHDVRATAHGARRRSRSTRIG